MLLNNGCFLFLSMYLFLCVYYCNVLIIDVFLLFIEYIYFMNNLWEGDFYFFICFNVVIIMVMFWNYILFFLFCLIFIVKGFIFGDEVIGGFKFIELIKGVIKSKFWNIFFLM